MKAILVGVALAVTLCAPAHAQNANWGQEVKACNQSNCYPDDGSRGDYVRQQARDSEGPGYAKEIHSLASPGKSEPRGRKF